MDSLHDGTLHTLADRCLTAAKKVEVLFYELIELSNADTRELEEQLKKQAPERSVLETKSYCLDRPLDLASIAIANISKQ